ncbi:cysteine-rich CWC family protein [Solibacillus sp. FSL H8-0538]|uniref:cysteine-rich CWC family protein n=1 Tax=Solibacillus sp. FSL H8-0538 TaxID=2921400 RepID=UPI0030FB2E3A
MKSKNCPICEKDNQCFRNTESNATSCWCMEREFPEGILEQLPTEAVGKQCICENCLDQYAKQDEPV